MARHGPVPPVTRGLTRRAGRAFAWQGVQHLGARLVYLARIPILARLLAPEDFGLLAISIIAVEVVLHLTNFGFVPALVQRGDAEPRHYDAAWTAGLLRSSAVAVAVAAGAPWIAAVFDQPEAEGPIRLLALRPVLQASASIGVARLTRDLDFRGLAALSLTEAFVGALVSIALATSLGVWALVAGALAGPLAQTILSYRVAPHRPRLQLDRDATASLLRFGRWVYGVGLVALLGRTVLHGAISRQLGAAELGVYFLAGKLAFLPSEVAAELVGVVVFPLVARMQGTPAEAARLFRRLLRALLALLVPALALVVVLAPSLVDEVLGARWEGSAPVVRILALACGAGLLADAAAPVLKGMGRPDRVLALELVQTSILVVLVLLLPMRFGLPGAAFAWVPASLAGSLVAAVALRGLLRPGDGWIAFVAALTAAVAAGAMLAHRVDAAVEGLAGLVLGGGAGAAIAYGGLAWADRRFGLGLAAFAFDLFPGLRRTPPGAGAAVARSSE